MNALCKRIPPSCVPSHEPHRMTKAHNLQWIDKDQAALMIAKAQSRLDVTVAATGRHQSLKRMQASRLCPAT